MDKYIDLHIHTNASDGSMSPTEVVRYAASKGLAAIAITDHDTIEGVEQALSEGIYSGIEVVPGIEISVEFEIELHILGYYIDIDSNELLHTLKRLNDFRYQRNPQIINILNDMGFDITMEEVIAKAQGSVVGRPHIAGVMVEKGYVGSIDEAFEKFLGRGRPAFVKKRRLTPLEGIELIHKAGGLAVLAHPIYLERENIALEVLLKKFIEYGLDGIEAYYPEYTEATQQKYLSLAQKYRLFVTGGSDFHGDNKPEIELGRGHGNLQVPYCVLKKLKGRIC